MSMRRLKKILTWIVAGSSSVIIAACYGVMRPIGKQYLALVKDRNANPINNIQVAFMGPGSPASSDTLEIGYSDTYGRVYYESPDMDGTTGGTPFMAVARDIDGSENRGSYRSTSASFGLSDTVKIIMDKEVEP
jgi:hypothetical protein